MTFWMKLNDVLDDVEWRLDDVWLRFWMTLGEFWITLEHLEDVLDDG